MGRLKTLPLRVAPAPQACAPLVPKAADPYYSTPEWRALREACFERDGYMCTVPGCGRPAKVPDHIVARKQGGADALYNLRSLCASHDSACKEDHLGHRRGGG